MNSLCKKLEELCTLLNLEDFLQTFGVKKTPIRYSTLDRYLFGCFKVGREDRTEIPDSTEQHHTSERTIAQICFFSISISKYLFFPSIDCNIKTEDKI